MITNCSNEPSPDAIVEGIHRIRDGLLAQHGGDMKAYFDAAYQRQQDATRAIASRAASPRRSRGVIPDQGH